MCGKLRGFRFELHIVQNEVHFLELENDSSRQHLNSYNWDRSQSIPSDIELAVGMFFSDYFVFLYYSYSINASYSFVQLLLTPYNFKWTAQIGQAQYRDFYERFCKIWCDTNGLVKAGDVSQGNMFRKINNSQILEYETQVAFMSELEIMPLKFPYPKTAQTSICCERILHNLFCNRTKWIWIPKRKNN